MKSTTAKDWNDWLKPFSGRHPIFTLTKENVALLRLEESFLRLIFCWRWNDRIKEEAWARSQKTVLTTIPTPITKITLSNYRPANEALNRKLPSPGNMSQELTIRDTFKDFTKQVEKKWTECSPQIIKDTQWTSDLKEFLKTNNHVLVSTDKTKRTLILPREDYNKMGEEFLKEAPEFKRLPKDPSQRISRVLNTFVASITDSLNMLPSTSDKLKTREGATPSPLTLLIKDHKPPNDKGLFAIRPVVSVHGAPNDNLDHLTQYILGQALPNVLNHIHNTDHWLHDIKTLSIPAPKSRTSLFSLDIVSLFTKVPLMRTINLLVELISHLGDQIDRVGLSISQFRQLLSHVLKNCIIKFNDKVYIQTEGLGMGLRSSPPAAILLVYIYETTILKNIHSNIPSVKVIKYNRYVDDTLIICTHSNAESIQSDINHILDEFNAMDPAIQFTMEPPTDDFTPYLDTELRIVDGSKNCSIEFRHYCKTSNSGNCLRWDSHAPINIRTTLAINNLITAVKRSSSQTHANYSWDKAMKKLSQNGYPKSILVFAAKAAKSRLRKTSKNITPFDELAPKLMIPFISDDFTTMIKRIIKTHNLDFKVIHSKFDRISSLNPKPPNPHLNCTCHICSSTNTKGACSWKHVVYKLDCNHCNASYIGKTDRSLAVRYNEHTAAIRNDPNRSTFALHLHESHPEETPQSNINVKILNKCSNGVLTSIREAMQINNHENLLNKKFEQIHSFLRFT